MLLYHGKSASEPSNPRGVARLRHDLEIATKQIREYEEDLRLAHLNQRLRDEQLQAAQQQLQAYEWDFERARCAERRQARVICDAQEDALCRLLRAARFRDEETGIHIRRVGLYSRVVARDLGLDPATVHLLSRAAQLHDIGKIGVPDAILRKPGRLDAAEFSLMREHSTIGAQMLEGSQNPLFMMARQVALGHHEHFDGSGYPHGLHGSAIPLAARITSLADTYDALRMPRTYKPAFDHRTAVATILYGDGRTRPEHFDPVMLEIFRRLHRVFEAVFETGGDDLAEGDPLAECAAADDPRLSAAR
jgi:putative two-component system response regulator